MEGEWRALRCCTDRQESRGSHGAHTLLHCGDRNNLKEGSITDYGFGGGFQSTVAGKAWMVFGVVLWLCWWELV